MEKQYFYVKLIGNIDQDCSTDYYVYDYKLDISEQSLSVTANAEEFKKVEIIKDGEQFFAVINNKNYLLNPKKSVTVYYLDGLVSDKYYSKNNHSFAPYNHERLTIEGKIKKIKNKV